MPSLIVNGLPTRVQHHRAAWTQSTCILVLLVVVLSGFLGTPSDSRAQSLSAIPPMTATAISAGDSHTCVIVQGGGVRCWGNNFWGQLGDGTTTDRSAPVDVVGLTSGVISLDASNNFTCAVTASGGVKCWGWNNEGQLGNGTTTDSSVPVDVIGLNATATAVATSAFSACALLTSGGVRCWGQGDFIGDLTPVDVSGLTSGVRAIAGGFGHSCAVLNGGGAKCWGWNLDGQVGDGTVVEKYVPVDVVGLTSGVQALTANGEYYTTYGRSGHTCALTVAGGVKCWGWNEAGQLGDGTERSKSTPVNVIGLTSGVHAISAGNRSTCALLDNNEVKCWGSGVLAPTPTTISGLPADLTAIAAGSYHWCVLRQNGSVMCWGSNYFGQLGDGTTEKRTGPVEVVRLGIPTYRITGRVSDRTGRGLVGVTVATNTGLSTTTAADGTYTLTGVVSGTYTLTPIKSGYTFTPATLSVTVAGGDLSGQDFVGVEKPSIVVLVHGWQGVNRDVATWKNFECRTSLTTGYTKDTESPPGWGKLGTLLTQSGYRVYVASWTTRPGYSMTAEDAATQCLSPSIRSVADQDRNGKVILIAHSMGGLVSRAYIEDTHLYQHNVERLITLGTPHTGVNIQTLLKFKSLLNPATAALTIAYCVIDPGTCQLGSDQALLFNMRHQPNTPVIYNFVAGVGGPWWLGFLNDTEGRNDGIVGYRSATGYQYQRIGGFLFSIDLSVEMVHIPQANRGYTNAAHINMFGTSYFDHQESLNCVSRYLDIPNQSHDCSSQVLASLNQNTTQQPVAYTPSSTGILHTGNTLTTTLDLDGSSTDVMLGWDRGTLSMTLTTPDGVVINGTNIGQIVPGASYKEPANASDMALVSYHLPTTTAGRWTATIAATTVVTDTNYTLFAATQSPLQIAVAAPTSVGSGQSLAITTTISESTTLIDGATVVASLPRESGAQQVTLSRTAAGIYTGQLIAPTSVGPHILTVTANGGTGKPFARQVDQMVTVRASGVQRQGAATVTPIDRNGNGRYEALQMTTAYTVTTAGDYIALATLQDASGRSIATTRTTATWATGTQTLRVTFDGGTIATAGVNGPYHVIVQIIAADNQHLVADEQPLIAGLNYQASSFEFLSWVYLPLIRR